jgi:type IV pilus assembly protein PilY1
MIAGNQPPATDKPGFDPDFYDAGASKPWFFEPAKVYHDVIYTVPTFDGWTDWTTNPTGHASTADFCAQWAVDPAKQSSCNACMRDQGYFFDGSYFFTGPSCGKTDDCVAANAGTCIEDGTPTPVERTSGTNDGTAHCKFPHVWFSGNFLNFHPPKFIVARKVLKDVLQTVRRVRLGLTVFSSSNDGGTLLDPVNPPCNLTGSPASYDANRTAIMSAINSKLKVTFSSTTPLAETLLDVGQLYLRGANTWFDSTYEKSGFEEKAGNNRSVCFSCQASAVLLITDGMSSYDGKIPGPDFAAVPMTLTVANQPGSLAGMAGYNITDISSADCPVCNTAAEAADTSLAPATCAGQQASGACDDNRNPIPSYLPKVAWYLKNMDFRPDAEVGTDGLALTKKQSVSTYTIGLGTRASASAILQHTAEAGGGLYNGGSGDDVTDAKTLRDAIVKVLEDVNTRSTSFGAASLSTLQITSSQGVLIPRFEPSRNANWTGHLYAFDLYSEFVAGCVEADPAVSGPANKDYDCDGKCQSVFLKDADGAFIQEDSVGAFKKNLDPTKAPCGGRSHCSAAKCSDVNPNAPARPFWDAGSKLAPVKTTIDPLTQIPIEAPNPDFALEWSQREIYTVVDSAAPFGKLTSADAVIELSGANAATLVPYLNLKGTRYCQKLASRLTSRSNPDGATIDAEVGAGIYTTCAKVLVEYVRGADVFN